MSTIPSASPRPSITLSSRRTSTSTAPDPAPSDRTAQRRNKASALRDYYGIQTSAAASNPPSSPPTASAQATLSPTSELDAPSFDTNSYVTNLLSRSPLAEILRVESNLLAEIRTLDGEKKALVYDNYSKLIAATETIARMRTKMGDGMEMGGMGTVGLEERVGKIAELAEEVERETKLASGRDSAEVASRGRGERESVRWVLSAPERLGRLVQQEGGREEAQKEWKEVSALLDKWGGVRGVEEVRARCLEVMQNANEKG